MGQLASQLGFFARVSTGDQRLSQWINLRGRVRAGGANGARWDNVGSSVARWGWLRHVWGWGWLGAGLDPGGGGLWGPDGGRALNPGGGLVWGWGWLGGAGLDPGGGRLSRPDGRGLDPGGGGLVWGRSWLGAGLNPGGGGLKIHGLECCTIDISRQWKTYWDGGGGAPGLVDWGSVLRSNWGGAPGLLSARGAGRSVGWWAVLGRTWGGNDTGDERSSSESVLHFVGWELVWKNE